MNMVVDTSAIVAIYRTEAGSSWLRDQLRGGGRALMAAPNALELGMVLEGRRALVNAGAAMLDEYDVVVTDFDQDLAARALQAWRWFGKGRHPAALNFGDCCTYALAHKERFPILCVGNDFARTDLPVLRPPEP